MSAWIRKSRWRSFRWKCPSSSWPSACLCSRSEVDSHRLRRGQLSCQDRDQLAYAVGELSQGQIFIDDTPGLTLMDLRTKGRRLKRECNIEMIVLDYLQLMEPRARKPPAADQLH